jgi:hypothetical protein
VPHEAAPLFWQVPCGSTPPAGTLLHVPSAVGSAQVWHEPLHAELQHTPCAQSFETHSLPSAQVLPRLLRPHEPLLHTAGDAQSALAVHATLHTFVPQLKGKHELAAGVWQAPLPSHVDPGVKFVVPAGQLEPMHGVPFAYFWQAPAWHLPFVPQEAPPMSLQMPAGSVEPVETFVQTPSVPLMAHDWHAPVHALSQHTPCAQKPEPHSLAAEHEAPGFLRPHELPLQTLGERQSLPVGVQALKQAVTLQTYGLHGSESGATHWPVELHVEGGV